MRVAGHPAGRYGLPLVLALILTLLHGQTGQAQLGGGCGGFQGFNLSGFQFPPGGGNFQSGGFNVQGGSFQGGQFNGGNFGSGGQFNSGSRQVNLWMKKCAIRAECPQRRGGITSR